MDTEASGVGAPWESGKLQDPLSSFLGLCKLQLLTNTEHTTFHIPSTHVHKNFSHLFTYSHSSHLLLALFGFHRPAQKSPSTWKTCRAPRCVAQALAAATFYSCCCCCGTCCCWARVWPVFFIFSTELFAPVSCTFFRVKSGCRGKWVTGEIC